MPSIWLRLSSQLPKEVGFGCYSSKVQLSSRILTTSDSVQALENTSSITVSSRFLAAILFPSFSCLKPDSPLRAGWQKSFQKWNWNLECMLNIPTQECWFCALFLHGALYIVQDILNASTFWCVPLSKIPFLLFPAGFLPFSLSYS